MTREMAFKLKDDIGIDGVMCAKGLLRNPAMFSSEAPLITPLKCVYDYLDIAAMLGEQWGIAHHHLAWMLYDILHSAEKRRQLNSVSSVAGALDFLEKEGLKRPTTESVSDTS